jgi:quinol monooxygenase YgiN
MHVLTMKFTTKKTDEELRRISEESFPTFREMRGLMQKYWVKNDVTGQVGGVYIWNDADALQAYLDGPIVAAIPEKFDIVGQLEIERFDVEYVTNDPALNAA